MNQRIDYPSFQVEHVTTRDTCIDEPNDGWTMRPCPPPGEGWQNSDASSDHKTRWRRVRLDALSGLTVRGGRR